MPTKTSSTKSPAKKAKAVAPKAAPKPYVGQTVSAKLGDRIVTGEISEVRDNGDFCITVDGEDRWFKASALVTNGAKAAKTPKAKSSSAKTLGETDGDSMDMAGW